MKAFVASLLLAIPLAAAQNESPLPPVTLYTEFAQQPPPAVLSAIQSEVQSIMAPMGLSFKWLSLSAYENREVSVELAVITFKGRCDVGGLSAQSSNPGALGWTHISDGIILPFADIDCSAVRSFAQRELYFMHPEDRELVFGRALGRVLAHELYHIFANTRQHGSEGVGRESYAVHDLLEADFQFEAHESLAIIRSKAHAALANAAASSDDMEPQHHF